MSERLLIINSAEPDDFRFTDPLQQILSVCKISEELHHWTEFKGIEQIDEYEGVIISASPRGDNDNFDERLSAFRWLKTFKKPVFGICAGHQLTAVTFGSRLIKDVEAEEGKVKVRILKEDPIFLGMKEELDTEQHHNDSVSLPLDFDLLASSEKCTVQAVKHNSFPIYTVQWHAEQSNPEMVLNFVRIVLGEHWAVSSRP
ncbi:MAG: glutamine amidotransferase-related protein [Bacteroidota bacterium]